jgi:2-amino-4-hydroxy-6-hydroxymethyldihydropteridine diphosphokinase
MNNVYLLTGGNEGNSFSHLQQARAKIEEFCGRILQESSLYETAAWGKTDQPAFLNQALLLRTELDAPALMRELLRVESSLGRKRIEKYGPRIIDIDILFFNNEVFDLPDLKIPHPQFQFRRFALEPMNEIAQDFIHPILHKTIRELLNECADPLDVKKL